MADNLLVKGDVKERVTVLTIHFGGELLLERGIHQRLSAELTGRYRQIQEKEKDRIKTPSCIVVIDAEVAGSPLVRALFDLWREVVGNRKGQLVCVNYPQDYIESLTSLGLPALVGFSLARSEEDALSRLQK